MKEVFLKYHFILSYFLLSTSMSVVMWYLIVNFDFSLELMKTSMFRYCIEVFIVFVPGFFLGTKIKDRRQLFINCISIYIINLFLSVMMDQLPSYGRLLDIFKYLLFVFSLPCGYVFSKQFIKFKGQK